MKKPCPTHAASFDVSVGRHDTKYACPSWFDSDAVLCTVVPEASVPAKQASMKQMTSEAFVVLSIFAISV